MRRNVTFKKSTELNAPPQVFLSLNEANGLELWKRSRVLFCSQAVTWHFAARALFFFCYIPFRFLEIQMTGVKNFTNKNVSVTSPLPLLYKPTKNRCDSAQALGLHNHKLLIERLIFICSCW